MRSPAFWYAPIGATAIGLMPLTLVYGAAEALRRRLTKPEKPEIPVICVGNLTAGGAGKTPAVRALADMLHGSAMNCWFAVCKQGVSILESVHID